MTEFHLELDCLGNDGKQGFIKVVITPQKSANLTENIMPRGKGDAEYYAAVDAILSMVLAHACAGVCIQTPEYIQGVNEALEYAAEI